MQTSIKAQDSAKAFLEGLARSFAPEATKVFLGMALCDLAISHNDLGLRFNVIRQKRVAARSKRV
jgi:hypothetical protein